MNYNNIYEGRFIERPNRFIAHIKINDNIEICHVKNTGRCKELLLPDATVYVQHFPNTKRKTSWDLMAFSRWTRIYSRKIKSRISARRQSL